MKKRKLLAVAFVGMTLLVSSCQKDEESTLPTSSSQSGEVEMTKSELLSKVADLKESELKNDSGFENNLIVGEYLDAIGKAVANNDGMEKVTLQTMLNMEEAVKNKVKVSLAKKGNSSEKSSWTNISYPISKSISLNDRSNIYDAQGRFYTTFTSGSVEVYIMSFGLDAAPKWLAVDYYRFVRHIFGHYNPRKNIYLELYDRNDVKFDHNYHLTMRRGLYYTSMRPFISYTGGTNISVKRTHPPYYNPGNDHYFFDDNRAGAIYRFAVHY